MRSCWILCCVCWYTVAVSCSFNVQNGTIWEPEQNCVLATPALQFSPLQMTVQFREDLLEDGEKAWLGYAMEYVEFQYKGCAHLPTLNHTKVNTSLDLGQCYFACKGKPFFGLTKDANSCRCLTAEITKENLKQRDCTDLCDNQSFLCGSTTSMSIYERVITENITGKEESNLHQCLSYIEKRQSMRPKPKYFSWKGCSEKMKAMCIDDDENQTKHCPKKKWSEPIKACLADGKYPMPHTAITGNDTNVWLGVVLTIAITEYTATEGTNYLMYGYVQRQGDHYQMNFTNKESSGINKTICKTDSESTTTTTTKSTDRSTLTTTSVTSMSTSTVGYTHTTPLQVNTMSTISTMSLSTASALKSTASTVKPTATITLSLTTEHMNDSASAQALLSTPDSQQSNVGVLVGVPVAILVVIGIICAVIFLWRRRKQSKDSRASSRTHHNGAYIGDSSTMIIGKDIVSDKGEVDPQTKDLQPNVYDLISDVSSDDKYPNANANMYVDIEDVRCDNKTSGVMETAVTGENNGGHNYFVLEKSDKQPRYTDKPSKHMAHEDETNSSANHVYNIAGYSTLNVDKGVYDHIGGNKGRPRDDTSHYDTTSSTKQTDGTYDTTSSTKHSDGTYDTTSSSKQTDGTYDTTSSTKQTEGTYDTSSPY